MRVPRRRVFRSLLALGVLGLLAPAAGCNTGDEETDLPSLVTGTSVNASFTADADPACPRADLVSIQANTILGSAMTLDLVVTDCDGSLDLSGLAFEVAFDSTVVNFVGCAAGGLFPRNQLVAGTPACTLSGGNVLGTIALTPPSFVSVGGGGQATAVRLTFNVVKKGVSSPITFVGTDSSSGTSLFFLDPATQATTTYTLGSGGYAGGTFISN